MKKLFPGAIRKGSLLFLAFSFISSTSTYAQWTQTTGPEVQTVWSLAVSGTNLFAGTGGAGVYLSTNNGASWTAVNAGLTNTSVRSLAVSGTNLFAGTFDGVFLSTNNGSSWSAVSPGLTNFDVRALAVSGSNLFAGVYFGGVWRRPLSQLVSVREISDKSLPKSFRLEQNYPNPFNPSTTIEFSLARSAYVTLKVFNLLGQEVETLVSQDVQAGKHSSQWNPKGIASGAYYYRLVAGSFVETKRMLLLR